MHNAQAMKVGDSPEDLPYKVAGILLCVGAPLHDAVKQFTTSHPGDRRNEARGQLTQTWILALHPFCPAPPQTALLTAPWPSRGEKGSHERLPERQCWGG